METSQSSIGIDFGSNCQSMLFRSCNFHMTTTGNDIQAVYWPVEIKSTDVFLPTVQKVMTLLFVLIIQGKCKWEFYFKPVDFFKSTVIS